MGNDVATVEAVELGKILEIEVDGRLIEFPSRPPIYWLPQARALFWSTTKPRRRPSSVATARQIATYRRWHADEPSKGARIESYRVAEDRDFTRVGELSRIDYHSKKWGDSAEYTHESRGGSTVWMLGSIWIVKGKISLTNRGLIK
jgi:hypothetical protein